MSRAALLDAACNAGEQVQVEGVSAPAVRALIAAATSPARAETLDLALDAVTALTRSLRERHDGNCFFSALSMASDSLTGRHYTVDELKQLLAHILQSADLIGGWENYRESEASDLDSIAYYQRNQMVNTGKYTAQQVEAQYKEWMQEPTALRNMSRQQYLAHVLTPDHWANEDTLLIYSSYFNIQFVPLRSSPANPEDWVFVPVKRGGDSDAFIFLYFTPQGRHYDLLLSKVPGVEVLGLEQISREEITVFTKDTLSAANYRYVKNALAEIAVTPVLYSKLPVVE